jgi:hypothetical protein
MKAQMSAVGRTRTSSDAEEEKSLLEGDFFYFLLLNLKEERER